MDVQASGALPRRRLRLGLLLVVLVAVAALVAGARVVPAESSRGPAPDRPSAAQFVDSVGVNVHMSYDDTPYRDAAGVRARLTELGVSHVRDGLVAGREDQVAALQSLAGAGIRSQLIMGRPDDPDGRLAELLTTARTQLPDAISAFEGPNEYDRTGGPQWQAALRPYQQALYDAVRADPVLRRVPVVGPSVPDLDLTGALDAGNIHPYPGGGPPEQGIAGELARARAVSGDAPVQVTESGYHNATASTAGHPGVSEQAAAVYLPRMFLEYFRLGVPRTFAYELVDLNPEPQRQDQERHFGLLRTDLTPKPSYDALRHLLAVLADEPGPASSALTVQVPDPPADLRSLELARRDGSLQLVLWRAAPVYDTEAHRDLTVLPETVSVTLSEPSAITVHRPVTGGDPLSRSEPTAQFTVTVGADPVVLTLTPAALATSEP